MKRIILAIALVLGLSWQVGAAVTLVQQSHANGGNATTLAVSLSSVTTGNSLFLLTGCNRNINFISTLQDSSGDIWTKLVANGGTDAEEIWEDASATAGVHSLTLNWTNGTGGATYFGALMAEFAGVSFWNKSGAPSYGVTSAMATASVTPDYSTTFIIATGNYTSASAVASGPTNGFNALTPINDSVGQLSTYGAWIAQSARARTNTSWTLTAPHNMGTAIVVLTQPGAVLNPGTTWYVNRDTGLDTNNGTTTGTPWQHAQYCMDNAAANDTCKIIDTTNRSEDLFLTNSAVLNHPITLTTNNPPADIANPDRLGRLLGVTNPGCVSGGCGKLLSVFIQSGTNNITLDHLDISNQETAVMTYTNGNIGGIGANGIGVNANNTTIQHVYVHDTCRDPIVSDPSTFGTTVAYSRIRRYGAVSGISFNGYNNLSKYNDISDAEQHIYLLGTYGGVNFSVCGSSGADLAKFDSDWYRLMGWNVTVDHNYLHGLYDASGGSSTDANTNCNGAGTQLDGLGSTVPNPYCTGTDAGQNGNYTSAHHDCIQTCPACAELGNTNTPGAESLMTATITNNICVYNTINSGNPNQHTGNIEAMNPSQCTGLNQPVTGCTGNGTGSPIGMTFINNWFLNTGQLGFGPGGNTLPVIIEFNTWDHDWTHMITPTDSPPAPLVAGSIITDNVFFDPGVNGTVGNKWFGSTTPQSVTGSHNICGNRIGGGCSDANQTFTTTANVNNTPGFTLLIDPATIDPSLQTENDMLVSGSPIIHSGAPIAGITTDILGYPRPNPPSAGAFESDPVTQTGGGGSFE